MIWTQKISRYSMKTKRIKRTRRRTRGGYKQYLSNVGYLNGYVPSFDRTMTTPSANRTAFNWS
jgi:hypothetical protein